MFKKLKELLQRVLTRTKKHTDLEEYLSGKNPTNTVELEHWVTAYMQRAAGDHRVF
jgi:hypothetical protein